MRSYTRIVHVVSEVQIAWGLEIREVEACMLMRLTYHPSLVGGLGIGKQASCYLWPQVLEFWLN